MRRYEELHKQGKTDEAKADLARLEEVYLKTVLLNDPHGLSV